jgi:hypothetical protein
VQQGEHAMFGFEFIDVLVFGLTLVGFIVLQIME